MNIQKTFFLTIILALTGASEFHAQSAALSAGGDASGAGGKASYSVGQVAYTSIIGESGLITLGVQQPYEVIMVGINDPAFAIHAQVFPNPASSAIFLKLELDHPEVENEKISLGLYDMQGRLLLQHDIKGDVTTVPLDNLSDAMYMLRVMNKQQEVKTFKIFKTQ